MGYSFDVAQNHFWKISSDKNGLPQLMWHITNLCGLHCKFCFSRKEPQELDIARLQEYIKRFEQLAVQKIDISGGEPLMYAMLPDVCNALCEAGIFITLTTRGIGTEKNIHWVMDNQDKFTRLIVSADVPTSHIFEKLSGEQNGFEKMQRFVSLLKRVEYRRLRINTVVTRFLLDEDVLMDMVKWIKFCGCQEWCLIEPHPANKKKTFGEVSIKPNEFEQVCSKVKESLQEECECNVLIRYAVNYSGYWVIYPEGILAKHSDGENDLYEMNFLKAEINEMQKQISKSKLWIPEGK